MMLYMTLFLRDCRKRTFIVFEKNLLKRFNVGGCLGVRWDGAEVSNRGKYFSDVG